MPSPARPPAGLSCLLARQWPSAQLVADGAEKVRLDVQQGAEFAAIEHLLERLRHCGETPIVAYRQDDPRIFTSLHRIARRRCGQGEGFLDEHVLAGFGGLADVFGVQRVRGGEDHRIYVGVGEDLLIGVVFAGSELLRKGGPLAGGTRITRRDAELVGFALHGAGKLIRPPAQSYGCGVQHGVSPATVR